MEPTPEHIEIGLRTIVLGLTVVALLTSGITFVLTKLYDAYSMPKKYRLASDSEDCMTEREKQEKKINEILDKVDKRMTLGNLMLFRLWGKAGLPQSEVQALEKAVGIKIND
jgi:hypothetical protein